MSEKHYNKLGGSLTSSMLEERFLYNVAQIEVFADVNDNLARVHLIDLHLIVEIATRTVLQIHNATFKLSSHSLSGLVSKFRAVEPSIFSMTVSSGIHSEFSSWDYNELRFAKYIKYNMPPYQALLAYFTYMVTIMRNHGY